MTLPDWYALLLMGLGVYRICRLVGWDDITIPPRHWLTGLGDDEHSQWAHVIDTAKQHDLDPWHMTVGDWFDHMGDSPMPPLVADHGISYEGAIDEPDKAHFQPPVGHARYYISKMIRCPWCLGWWLGVLVWIAYQAAPRGTLIVMSLFAVSAIPGLVTKNLDK